MSRSHLRGFTLVELLVVISILPGLSVDTVAAEKGLPWEAGLRHQASVWVVWVPAVFGRPGFRGWFG
jgi:prepilin-type N-terminal cleavage/methylation domain-containing protein